jgi:hypothetical protein
MAKKFLAQLMYYTDEKNIPLLGLNLNRTRTETPGKYSCPDLESVQTIRDVLVSGTLVGLATRCYFLSECCGLVSVGRPL